MSAGRTAPAGVLLVHGGLYEPMDAERFWVLPEVADRLQDRGLSVAAPDRLRSPASWAEEGAHLRTERHRLLLQPGPVDVVAGSNGCSAALRLAIDHPGAVRRLVLCWPPTAGRPELDGAAAARIEAGRPGAAATLLAGDTVRGVADAELAALRVPVAVMASDPENPVHRWATAQRLVAGIPGAVELLAHPEPVAPSFAAVADRFVETIAAHLS